MDARRKTRTNTAPTRVRFGDLLFFILPPLVVIAAFLVCALVPHEGRIAALAARSGAPASSATPLAGASPNASPGAAAGTPSAGVTAPAASGAAASSRVVKTALGTAIVASDLPADPDPNATLPPYAIPDGFDNLLPPDTPASASATDAAYPLSNATDGSVENDDTVALALPAEGKPAWAEWTPAPGSTAAVSTVVIYGGGSQSKRGKLCGGFRVELTLADGSRLSRNFCEAGFALEGYEAWTLPRAADVRRLRISSLRNNRILVLRQVQLIGALPQQAQPANSPDQNTQP